MQSMYVRIKRKKVTVFVHVEPTWTVLEIRQKVQELLQQPLESQRLYKDGTLLEDARKLADLKIENDDVLALTFNVGGS
eukprot:jgi/Astpho2/3937/e_gw1.00063.222.1_t